MCRIKEYTDSIHKTLNHILFRIDLFAVPSAINTMMDRLSEFGGNYVETALNEYYVQVIDADNSADVLGLTLTEMMSKKLLIFNESVIGGLKCDIYLHKNFVALEVSNDECTKPKESIIRACETFIEKVTDVNFNASNVYLNLNHCVKELDVETIWGTFDRTAFPVMDEGDSCNGQYIDTFNYNPVVLDLSRAISPAETGEAKKVDVIVQTRAFSSIESLKNAQDLLENMFEVSYSETTRCFREGK